MLRHLALLALLLGPLAVASDRKPCRDLCTASDTRVHPSVLAALCGQCDGMSDFEESADIPIMAWFEDPRNLLV